MIHLVTFLEENKTKHTVTTGTREVDSEKSLGEQS